MGFFDDLMKDVEMGLAIEHSRDSNGRIDPWKAAGISAGLGYTSLEDTAQLGAMLGAQGAFDDDDGLDDF